MKVVIDKLKNKIVYCSEPEFEKGIGIKNAIKLYGGIENNYEEKDITTEELAAQKIQNDLNITKSKQIQELKDYLLDTDYKIIRQIEQPIMSEIEYNNLLLDRQNARNRINEIEAII